MPGLLDPGEIHEQGLYRSSWPPTLLLQSSQNINCFITDHHSFFSFHPSTCFSCCRTNSLKTVLCSGLLQRGTHCHWFQSQGKRTWCRLWLHFCMILLALSVWLYTGKPRLSKAWVVTNNIWDIRPWPRYSGRVAPIRNSPVWSTMFQHTGVSSGPSRQKEGKFWIQRLMNLWLLSLPPKCQNLSTRVTWVTSREESLNNSSLLLERRDEQPVISHTLCRIIFIFPKIVSG